jgi:hypothetical protein
MDGNGEIGAGLHNAAVALLSAGKRRLKSGSIRCPFLPA